jgi:hydroxymethylpyrimidine pyrophosphatase-like HAD family hydrolase
VSYGTAVPLSAVYTDLDGTLLGKFGSLFADAEGEFTMRPARALEACHRAGVEVVIMSGRRESTVASDARLLGQRSYIYEAGCGVMIDGERTYLTGDWVPDEDGTPAEKLVEAGIPELLFAHFAGRLEWHSPWHDGRELSLLMRGKVDVAEANELIASAGHEDLRFLDNGAIGRRMEGIEDHVHAYHLVPGGASKAKAVAYHLRARGYAGEDCIGVGDSIEDLEAAGAVGRFFVVANGPERDAALREALAGFSNATVTEGAMGDGFYEAVVSTLAERR